MEPLLGPLLWLVDLVRGRQRVQVLVHREVNGQPVVDLATETPVMCMKVTNLSNTHDVQITHIWYEVLRRSPCSTRSEAGDGCHRLASVRCASPSTSSPTFPRWRSPAGSD
jgi:hypothetical protein